MALSVFDLQVHSQTSPETIGNMKIGGIYNTLIEEATGFKGPGTAPKWCHSHVKTSHFMDNNESTYYAYVM